MKCVAISDSNEHAETVNIKLYDQPLKANISHSQRYSFQGE